MRHQFGEDEEPKKPPIVSETGSKEGQVELDELTDPEIDPADFFDPEEFGYRRHPDASHP